MRKSILYRGALMLALGLGACSEGKANPQSAQPAPALASHKMQVTHVNAKQARDLLQTQPRLIVLDVRTPAEFARGHIEGAVNIDFKNSNFKREIAALDMSQDYMIHCRSGGRSRRALTVFKAAGFSKLTHLDGGIIAWNKAGYSSIK